jgi:isochorismate synthase
MHNATAQTSPSLGWIYEGVARDEADLLQLLADNEGKRPSFYWEHPERGEAILGLGAVEHFVFGGPTRLADARFAVEALAERCAAGPAHDKECPEPVVVGGFSFSPTHEPLGMWREFPACSFVLPEELWMRRSGRTWCLTVRAARPVLAESAKHHGAVAAEARAAALPRQADAGLHSSGGPSAAGSDLMTSEAHIARWSARVERALLKMKSGALVKVVLARKAERTFTGKFDSVATLRTLRAQRPQCFTFRVAPLETVFLGSTPELLVRVVGNDVETHALAGTADRGATPESDRASARALLASAKNRYEQDLVARDVVNTLAPVAERVDADAEPHISSVPEAHHLMTPVRARLRQPLSALAVAERLHPTPATCGLPRRDAGALIDAEERDRGWYTGAVGWLSPSGDGAFAVALRSAVVDGGRLVAWAGAGIVAASNPAEEFAETEIKLRAVLGALGV